MDGVLTFAFGDFRFTPEQQLLLRGEQVVRIGGRALDLLAALVEQPGALVTKRDLIARAWPTTTVDEGNLKVNIAALRRALDDDASAARYIATVTGRGYRFIAAVAAQRASGPGGTPFEAAGSEPHRSQLTRAEARVRLVELPQRAHAGSSGHLGPSLRHAAYGIVMEGEIVLGRDGASLRLSGAAEDFAGAQSRRAPRRLRRMLVIELDAEDETWIRGAFARR